MRHFASLFLLLALLCPVRLVAAEAKLASTGRMVSIEVVIAQFAEGKKDVDFNLDSGDKLAARIAELEKQGQISQLTRMRLTTLDQNPAQLQFGQRTPVATGRTRARGFARQGGGANPAEGGGPVVSTSYTIENVGTLIGVTPHVEEDDTVSLKLELEKSHIEPAAAGEPGADATDVPPARTATLQSRSTVRLRSGQTAVVGQSQSSAQGESGQTVILVTAHVSAAPAPVKTPGVAQKHQLKVFALHNAQAEASAAVLTKLFKDGVVKIGADGRTNSVLAQGPPEVLSEIEAILSRLDQQPK